MSKKTSSPSAAKAQKIDLKYRVTARVKKSSVKPLAGILVLALGVFAGSRMNWRQTAFAMTKTSNTSVERHERQALDAKQHKPKLLIASHQKQTHKHFAKKGEKKKALGLKKTTQHQSKTKKHSSSLALQGK